MKSISAAEAINRLHTTGRRFRIDLYKAQPHLLAGLMDRFFPEEGPWAVNVYPPAPMYYR